MSLGLRYAARSDVGRVRRENQDSAYAGPHLLVIADGVGGAVRGDVASSAAVDELRRLDVPPATEGKTPLKSLTEAVNRAHDRLRTIVREHPELDGTSTTISAGIFDGSNLGIVHVGDSRGYLLRGGELKPLTTDHTFVQSLIDEGRITEEEARVHPHRNLILKAVDGVHEPEPDTQTVELEAGDRLLFCSDGCCGVLSDEQMGAIVGQGSLDDAAAQLVSRALDAGSSDNVTVVVAEVVEDAGEPVSPQVVGAAAAQPHLTILDDHTGDLDPAALGEVGAPGGPTTLDPEELRYAPRPPRRFLWLRRLIVLAVVAGLLFLGGRYLYDLSQEQYYVAPSGNHVAIYQGVQAEVPLIDLNEVAETSDIEMSALPAKYQRDVREGIEAEDLTAARKIIANLRPFAVCGETATPTPTPTPTTTTTPRPGATTSTPATKPSGTATPKPGTTATPKAPAKTDCGETP